MTTMITALELRIEELKKKRSEKNEVIAKIRKENSILTDEILDLEAQVLKLESEKLASFDDAIEFYLFNDGSTTSDSHYKERNKFFEDLGFFSMGYYPSINQQGLELKLDHDGSMNALLLDSITKVLPYMKVISGIVDARPNIKSFKIFEYTLSEYGSYNLFYDVDGDEWIVSIIAWHRRRDVYVTKSLQDVLEYISTNHPYDRPDDEDDTDYMP